MSQEFLLTILADHPEAHGQKALASVREAIREAVAGPGDSRHEVWEKRYTNGFHLLTAEGARLQEYSLGSIRVVGLGDSIHEEYRTWTPPAGEAKRLRLAVADQTRRRVLAAGATRVVVTVVSLDEASADTLNTDGTIDR